MRLRQVTSANGMAYWLAEIRLSNHDGLVSAEGKTITEAFNSCIDQFRQVTDHSVYK